MKWLCVLIAFTASGPAVCGEEWPRFRGPTGQGISQEKMLPTHWGLAENIVWKTRIPGEGWSSPIVWGDRVFLTTATDGGSACHVLALSRADGHVLWDVMALHQKPGHKQPKNSYATPTPVTDGRAVYAAFHDGSIVALTVEGRRLWQNRNVKHYSEHGLGSSPILYRHLLIMSFDGSSSGPDRTLGWQKPWDGSFILALDKHTGKERWRAKRGPSRIAHTTPVLATVAGHEELISSAGDVVQAFDPQTGERLWSLHADGEGVVPSPVVGEGLVFAASGFGKPTVRAVAPPKNPGEMPKVVWQRRRDVPMMASMVHVRPYLFLVSDHGIALCIRAATGDVVWRVRLPGTYSASPVYGAGRVYFLSEDGQTTVVATDSGQRIASNRLPGPCQASMAVAHGELFIRTAGQLFCIGPADGQPASGRKTDLRSTKFRQRSSRRLFMEAFPVSPLVNGTGLARTLVSTSRP